MQGSLNSIWQEKLLLYKVYDRDPEAFGKLYDIYAPKIYRYVYFKVQTATVAEDITADVFLKCWEYIQRREKNISSFKAFIYQLAKNAVADYYRDKARQQETVQTHEELDELPSLHPNLLSLAEDQSDMAMINQALQGLKVEYRDALVLKYIEDFSTSEIAKILEKSTGATRVTLHRALEALKNELKNLDNI